MASGPGTGVAAPPAEHIAKGTIHDPALIAAVQRAVATNDTASLQAMAPTLQAAADQASLLQGLGPSISTAIPGLAQALGTAITTSGNVVSLPPQQQQALQQVAQQFAQQPMQQYQAQVARAQVNRVTSSVDPQLEQIRRDLDHRSNQIQATSEHRRIEERDAFRRAVLGRLAVVEQLQRRTRY